MSRAWRITRGSVKIAIYMIAAIWLTGTVLVLTIAQLPVDACVIPFTTWAITWPLWLLISDHMAADIARALFQFCH